MATEATRLYRSRDNRMIAGVCGGIAEYFNVDPVLIRAIAVLLLIPGGLPGFIPYVILWILVPEKPAGT
jgi:phage shock protein C